MAAADQIKSLIKSFGESDEERFFASAMQIAASEARQGHSNFARELKTLIEKAKKDRSSSYLDKGKVVAFSPEKRDIHDLIEVYHPKINFDDMVLSKAIREALDKILKEQKHWQILGQHGLVPKRKLLLQGPPGCGKTMTAHAIAGELGIPVFVIRLDGLISKFMGESISKLRIIFDAMQDHRAVYLFDEFDSIGSNRNSVHDVGEIKRVLNTFLVNIEKDQSNSLIIAATNLPEALDTALFRRFDEILTYPLPSDKEIIETLKKRLSAFKFNERVNFKLLVKEAQGLNYSDLVSAAEDSIKEMILSEREKLKKTDLVVALQKKKLINGHKLR